jgi:hypothetical protein
VTQTAQTRRASGAKSGGRRPKPVAPPADLAGGEQPTDDQEQQLQHAPDAGEPNLHKDVAELRGAVSALVESQQEQGQLLAGVTTALGQLTGIVVNQEAAAPAPAAEPEEDAPTLYDQRAAQGYVRFYSPYQKYGIVHKHGYPVFDNRGQLVHVEPQKTIMFEDGIKETRDEDEIAYLRQQITDGNHDIYEMPGAQRNQGVSVAEGPRGMRPVNEVDERPIASLVDGAPPLRTRL